jgi:hypothetical protein
MLLLFACSLLAPVLPDANGKERTSPELELTSVEKEAARQQEVNSWAFKKSVSYQELWFQIYQPVLAGNTTQYKLNVKSAQRLSDRATQAKVEKAKTYSQLAQLFASYAEENKKIVNAIKKINDRELKAAFKKVVEIEDEIFKLTGKRVNRTWFTSDELKEARKTLSEKLQAEAAKTNK